MKILHVSVSDIVGGAERAAYRLHRALLAEGIDSNMIVQNKKTDDYTVIGPKNNFEKFVNLLRPSLDQLPVMFYKNKSKTLFSPSWIPFSSVIRKINEIRPDIVHLHWICGGMLRIEDIAKIKFPIVWTLHDMWAFTGGCHYDEHCGRYKKECTHCIVLNSNRENDLSKLVFRRKLKVYREKKIHIVAISKWIKKSSEESSLLGSHRHYHIPNLIDISIFKPFEKDKARNLWNLPKDKKFILFGAINATSDPRKGYNEILKALKHVKTRNIELIVFGSSKPKDTPDFGFKTHYLGHLHDDISLVTLYGAADVLVVPSIQENLSNTIMESLSCGTPVVAFDIGGNSDMIDHLSNGYLAKPFDTKDLAEGIDWILNSQNYDELSLNARRKVEREFDSKIVVKKYIQLYNEVLKEQKIFTDPGI